MVSYDAMEAAGRPGAVRARWQQRAGGAAVGGAADAWRVDADNHEDATPGRAVPVPRIDGDALLHAVLDTLPDGIRVLGADGRVLLQNAALSRLLTAPAVCLELEPALEQLRHAAVRLAGAARASDGRGVTARAGGFLLTAAVVHGDGLPSKIEGSREIVVIHVRPECAPRADATGVARRFGLTHRQAEVALLLARGLRNREVAARLGVTEHTARRHTERVLARLGASSRAQIAALMSEPR